MNPGQSAEDDAQQSTMARLRADHAWLAEKGITLTQWGPDPDSGKIKVYLARYSDEARQMLMQRYGVAITVAAEQRSWSFPESRQPGSPPATGLA